MLTRAEPERAGGFEPLHRGRGRGRDPALADLRAAFGELALRVVHVLVGERHAVQRTFRLAGGERAVGGLRGLQRILGLDARERIERRLPFVDAREQRLGDFDRRDLAPPDRGGEVLQVHLRDIAHRPASFVLHDEEARRLGLQRDRDVLGGIARHRRRHGARDARAAHRRRAARARRRRAPRCAPA